VILVDANILFYAYNSSSQFHVAAKKWLEFALSGAEPVRFSWNTLHAFLRISTNIRAYPNPFTPSEAIAIVCQWLERPHVGVLDPGERYLQIFSDLMTNFQIRGAMVMDAHLAALALEHGAKVCTHDADFFRFPDLSIVDPIISPE
jgi:uncharacterized protein